MSPEQLEENLHHKIPLVSHMGVKVTECTQEKIILIGELEKNRNHRMTAFGGSLNTLMTLAAWSWLTNFLDLNNLEASTEVVIQSCHTRYFKPIKEDIVVTSKQPNESEQKRFLETLEKKGIARLEISAEVERREVLLAKFIGQFVAMSKRGGSV